MPWEIRQCSDTDRNENGKGKRRLSSSNTDRKSRLKWSPTSTGTGTSSEAICRGGSGRDRLSSLPDQILGQILSLLPTKDVAALRVLSKRMGYAFSLLTTIDLDDTPTPTTYPATRNCHLVLARFPLFKSFVTNLLQKQVFRLTCFRLRFAGNRSSSSYTVVPPTSMPHFCDKACFPNLEPARLNAWLSYPLAHTGLRDLELTFHINNSCEYELPPQLFDFPSLEFFRVNANIKINGADIPLISLPNLKLMFIRNVLFTDPGFVPRLLSSCSSLEELSMKACEWVEFDRLTISSHSLRTMRLALGKVGAGGEGTAKITELVTIDTPNLKYFTLVDQLPYSYSITHMNVLEEAKLSNFHDELDDIERGVQSELSLLTALTNVQHLTLSLECLEIMTVVAELQYHLPVFRNLRTLTLPPAEDGGWRWDIVLLLIFHSSPLLETLVFPRGLFFYRSSKLVPPRPDYAEEACAEAEGWRTNTLPSCCLNHLKRIEFGICFGIDRELNMIQFILGRASVLEGVVLCLCNDYENPQGYICRFPKPNFGEFLCKLKELPKASNSCCILSS